MFIFCFIATRKTNGYTNEKENNIAMQRILREELATGMVAGNVTTLK